MLELDIREKGQFGSVLIEVECPTLVQHVYLKILHKFILQYLQQNLFKGTIRVFVLYGKRRFTIAGLLSLTS